MSPTLSKRKRPPRPQPPLSPDRANTTERASKTGTTTTSSSITDDTRPRSRPHAPKKSRLTSPTPSASDATVDEGSASRDRSSPASEPDFILAEVTHHESSSSSSSDQPVVPLSLLHRILHHPFRDKE